MSKKMRMEVRSELAFWQRGAVLLAVVLVIFAMMAVWVVQQQDGRERALESKVAALQAEVTSAKEIQQDAVNRLVEQVREFEDYKAMVKLDQIMEEAERAQAMAAYEAVGAYRYIGVCKLTAYCCESKDDPHICGTGTGLTASGLPVEPGMVAVDPDIIPLGSTVIINGVKYLAADTGAEGYHIDIAIQTHEDAEAFGVSSAAVWIIPPGGGEDGE